MDIPARHLLFHAALILLIGLLAGIPYGRAIVRQRADTLIQGWRVAHAALPLGAALMIAVAAVQSSLAIPTHLAWLLTGLLILSGYAFSVALVCGPLWGARGLTPGHGWHARIVYAGNLIGACSSLAAALLLVYAAGVSL